MRSFVNVIEYIRNLHLNVTCPFKMNQASFKKKKKVLNSLWGPEVLQQAVP